MKTQFSKNVARLLLCLAGLPAVHAATVTANFSVTATVTSSCSSPSTSALSFPAYNPLGATEATATTTVTVTCTNTTPYTVALNTGTGASATLSQRKMGLAGDNTKTLNYNLYTSVAYTSIWGDATSGNVTQAGTGTGSGTTFTVYGRVPSSQTTAVPGSYSDTITVTIAY
jgi:spore coat protein U-like protein